MKTSARASNFTNIRKPWKTDNGEVDNSNEIGSRDMGENLSKVNSSKTRFLTPEANVVFTCLRKAFIKGRILDHFNRERHIQIKTDALGFAIGKIVSQLTSGHVILSRNQPSKLLVNQVREGECSTWMRSSVLSLII